MADTTSPNPVGEPGAPGTTDPMQTSEELKPVSKVTRARATTSDVPARPPRSKAPAKSAESTPAQGAAASPDPSTGNGSARPANITISQGGADTVTADTVQLSQGGATNVDASSVSVHQGGIVNAQADDVSVSMGGIVLARGDRVSLEMGGMGVALAREAQITQGMARTVVAQQVRVDQGLVGTAMAGRVTFERPSGVFLLLAGKTEGPVKALLDWRGALAFGAAFGVIAGLLRRR